MKAQGYCLIKFSESLTYGPIAGDMIFSQAVPVFNIHFYDL